MEKEKREKRVEILAPAGNPEALKSAWTAGADAVYLGYSAFSARAGAGNFNAEELKAAIRFAHLHRMRVYVTVNTLLKDPELPEAAELLGMLAGLKADGILIQDLGLLRIARERYPFLALHASTQMAIHNAAGVRWCGRMGMRRVVLARECTLAEIRACVAEGPEIEVFCHGAQCVAVSGLCLFSSMVGGRSGNRGRCAQPCRMNYLFRGEAGAWLSPRDLCLRDDMAELAAAGVASLKIEGRLKRPEYVAVVAESYRRAMDAAEAGDFLPAGETEKKALRQIFNRGGFMRGYAFGSEDAAVIYPRSVQHQGIGIGRVEAVRGGMARVRLTETLRNGDGIRFRGRDGTETDMVYAGKETPAGEIAVIRLRKEIRAESGDRVMRLTDARQLEEARSLTGKPIRVRIGAEAWPGKPLRISVTDGESSVTLTGENVQAAENREVPAEEIARQLGKTGGTPFEAAEIQVHTAGAFVPVSALNALRRQALAEMEEKRIAAFEAAEAVRGAAAAGRHPAGETAQDRAEGTAKVAEAQAEEAARETRIPQVTVRTEEQALAARRQGGLCAWYPEDFRPEALEELGRRMAPGEWLRLPEVCEEKTLEQLGGVVLGSVGQLGLAWAVPFGAGPGIPVMNRESAALLAEQGCAFATASPELTGRELAALLAERNPIPIVIPVYGRTQLMILHHCPARTAMGLREGHRECRMCDLGSPESLRGECLRDRKGYAFPLLRLRLPEGCLVRLMNCVATDLLDERIAGVRTVELTGETGAEAEEILQRWQEYRRTDGNTTRGHWNRVTE